MPACRKNTVLAAAAAAVAVLSLGLTACGGGHEAPKAAADQAAPQGAPQPASGKAGAASGDQAAGKKGAAAGGASSGGGASTGTVSVPACTPKDVKITVAKAEGTPTEHVTLTAANTSGHSCRLYEYPLIAFGDVQTAKDVPAVAKSKPAAPVVLKAGVPAYANVRVAAGGAHEDNKVVTRFNVNLFAADGPAEGSVVVTAPAGGLAVDEAVAKTGYWTFELRAGADEF
ncbi:DUF4232 domain-containing protein [Streptomyces sp. NBC_01276]|uniref:DUF4232 domain-containing protein n=1 Tax=Streptomyces sp. NBC_01276 TaxID=2903808 RepID=UPI00352D65E0